MRSTFKRICCKQIGVLVLLALLLPGYFSVLLDQPDAYANPGQGNACNWYRVHTGDTLGYIARNYRANLWTLAHINHIHNINLIFTGQNLCIPYTVGHRGGGARVGYSGITASGAVRWYAYGALDWSSQRQVNILLRQAAARHGLPANLLLAVAWQESGWNQHVISHDGGIGIMQVMPYTAWGLDVQTRTRYDPYKVWDNIELGAIYLHSLWVGFHGNIYRIISAYNEGGWAVTHRGIFNWHYVNNVLALMRRF